MNGALIKASRLEVAHILSLPCILRMHLLHIEFGGPRPSLRKRDFGKLVLFNNTLSAECGFNR